MDELKIELERLKDRARRFDRMAEKAPTAPLEAYYEGRADEARGAADGLYALAVQDDDLDVPDKLIPEE